MPCRPRPTDDEDANDWDDDADDFEAEAWYNGGCGGDNDDAETEPCAHCGEMICEDAPQCPHCGHYTSDAAAEPRMKPLWIAIGSLACMYAIARWIFG